MWPCCSQKVADWHGPHPRHASEEGQRGARSMGNPVAPSTAQGIPSQQQKPQKAALIAGVARGHRGLSSHHWGPAAPSFPGAYLSRPGLGRGGPSPRRPDPFFSGRSSSLVQRKDRGPQLAAPCRRERVRSGRPESQTASLQGSLQLTHSPAAPQCCCPEPAPKSPRLPGSRGAPGNSLMRSPRWKLRRLWSSVM